MQSASLSPPPLRVTFGPSLGDRQTLTFNGSFLIGRTPDCDVFIKDEFVSRTHARVLFENGQWWVRDLQSANGIFVDEQRVEQVPVAGGLTFRLGIRGPVVSLEVEPPPSPARTDEMMVSHYMEHYFGKGAADKPIGEHTMIVRRAFQQVQKKQRWRYAWVAGVLVLLLLAAGGYALYEHQQLRKQQSLAKDLFYTMKGLDVDIANLENVVRDSNNPKGLETVRKYQNRRKDMQKSYDQFLTALHIYNPKLTEQHRLMLRVARIFGECELDMPPDFTAEVESYIARWKSSGRLANAIRTANAKGYAAKISEEMLAQDLPPQFFYLALQESDFDPYISGPMTYKGIAKGMWQFIPETAVKYGLKIGPLADLRRPDPADDRHHWEKATHAAAEYLKDLYSTDAQASGLLVMASYNWGENKVIPLIRSMPPNPRERNFWRLLSAHRDQIPNETYDYVFYIVSAAVIGENPRLFGFDFDNPLADRAAPSADR
jgi:membrane-bound lytic murein transglycosylase D